MMAGERSKRIPTKECFEPSVGLLAKLGSICQHVDEVDSPDGHHFDWAAIRALLEDSEVSKWLDQMHAHALLPVKRSNSNAR